MLSLTEESEYRSAVLKQLQQKVGIMAAQHVQLYQKWEQLVRVVLELEAERDQLRGELDRLIAERRRRANELRRMSRGQGGDREAAKA